MRPLHRTPLALLTVILLSPAAQASQWVSIRTLPGFADVQAQLQTLVNINGHHPQNHFCIVARQINKTPQADVYWQTENKLILWVPHLYDNEALLDPDRYLDLKTDVVPTPGTSTYKITRAFANEVLQQCRLHGDQFTIQKTQ